MTRWERRFTNKLRAIYIYSLLTRARQRDSNVLSASSIRACASMGSLRLSVAATTGATGAAAALACAGAAAAHRNADFEITALPEYQHFRPSMSRQDQCPRAFDGGLTLHSLICAFASTVGMPIGARAAMQAAKRTSRICVFIEHPCDSMDVGCQTHF
jgi:hypothetical protein